MKDGAPMASAVSVRNPNAESTDRRAREVLRIAEALYMQKPDWVTFFREILGVDGAVQRLYPTVEALAEYERTDANDRVQFLMARLREQRPDESQHRVPQRMITVRLPAPVHEALREEALLRDVSINQLCISKLLQMIDEGHVPGASADTVQLPEDQPIAKPK